MAVILQNNLFQSQIYLSKRFFTELNFKKSLISNTVEGIKIKEENEKNTKKERKHCHYLHKY